MAIPTITSDTTVIHYMENQTNLTAWGTNALNKWGNTPDIVIEGTNSHALAPSSTGDTGMGREGLGGINLSTNRLFIWINVTSTGFIQTSGSTPAGVYIRIVTNATTGDWATDYRDYYVGGSDIAWCGAGWHLVALDCNRSADRSNGTTTLTNIDKVGVGFNVTSTASKSDVLAVDVMRYGTKMEVTGVTSSAATVNLNDNGGSADTITRASGSFITDGFESGDIIRISGSTYNDGEYTVTTAAALTLTLQTGVFSQTETGVAANVDAAITLESIYQKDGPTDDNWYGAVSKDRNGNYEINYKLLVGDESGSSRTFFLSRGEQIIFADQPLSTSTVELVIQTAEDTGNTIVVFGESSGTGDSRVGYNGSIISQDATYKTSTLAQLDFDVAIGTMEFFGCTVLNVSDGAVFSSSTTHYITNTSFVACGQVDTYEAECRNLTFAGYSGTDGALLWRNGGITEDQVKKSRFLANSRATEFTASDAGEAMVDLTFAGNTYDVHFSAASGDLVINASGTSDPSQSKVEIDGTGSVTINNTVSVTLTVKDIDEVALEDADVHVRRNPPTSYTSHASNNSQGDTTFEVQENIAAADAPISGCIRVRDASTGQDQLYRYASWASKTFTLVTKVGPYACTAGGDAETLKDTGRDVTALDIEVGDTIRNETDGSWAIVLDIVDTDTIQTTPLQGGTDNSWDTSDNYSVHTLAVAYNGNDTLEVYILKAVTNASGVAQITDYNYSAPAKNVTYQSRKSGYKERRGTGQIDSGGFSQPIGMDTDPNYDL